VIEASKQCGRNVLMRIVDTMTWENYVNSGDRGGIRILAHPYHAGNLAEVAKDGARFRIAIGPEGGFTDGETAAATALGWNAVALGPRILRVETAAVVLATRVIDRLPR
jgi:16S rRNA (uracil1498-N3)-methyltransferase